MYLARLGKHADWAYLLLRVTMGAILAVHGYAKLAGGVPGVAGYFGNLGIPAPLIFAWIVTLLELFGGIALILGVLTRYVSAALVIQFAYITFGSIIMKSPKGAFFSGWEDDLLILAVVIALTILGNGKKLSLEKMMLKKEF